MQRFCLAIALLFFAVSSAFGFSINDFTKTSIPINQVGTGGIPMPFAVDIDNDGNQEIVFTKIVNIFNDPTDTTAYKVYIFDCNGKDITSDYFDMDVMIQQCRRVFAEDFNSDGKKDLLFITTGPDVHPTVGELNRLFLSNTSDKKLHEKPLPGAKDFSHNAACGDIDDDGDIDVLVASHGTDINLYFYINDGAGNFTYRLLDDQFIYGSCSLADMDKDGKMDIVLGIWHNDNITETTSCVVFGDGSGNFNFANKFSLPKYANLSLSELSTYDVQTYDINNDGLKDIILGAYGNNCYKFSSQIIKNKGNRVFEDITNILLPVNFIDGEQMMFDQQSFQSDINGDGYKDIVFGQMAIYSPNGVTLPDDLPFALIASGDKGDYSVVTYKDAFPNIDVLMGYICATLTPLETTSGTKMFNTVLDGSDWFVLNLFTRYIAPTGTPSSGGGGGCSIGSSALMIVLLLPVIALKRLF